MWILYLVPNVLLVDLVNYRLIGYGLVALAIMLLFPDGLVGTIENRLRRWRMAPGGADVGAQWIMDVTAPVAREAGATAAQTDRRAGRCRRTACARRTATCSRCNDVTLSVARGTIHGLVGPNGSGKTTLLNVMSGLARVDHGRIRILGTDTTRLPAYRTARLGVGPHVPDASRVRGPVDLGEPADRRGLRPRAGAAPTGCSMRCATSGARWREQRPDFLPHAQRRLLEVLRVIAMDCDVLLLDEPAAGLSPDERRDFATLLRHLRDTLGKTIVLVEHDLDLVWRVADRITVLDAGRDRRRRRARRDRERSAGPRAVHGQARCLRSATCMPATAASPCCTRSSLDVQPGEVVLVLGRNGAGKSTLLRSIAGFIKPTRGTVTFEGRDITGQSPETNARQGLRLILDGHRVFPELTVADNIRLGAAIHARATASSKRSPDRCSISFRSCARSCDPRRAICAAASSRCSRWRRRSSRVPRCCCATSLRSGSRRR